MRGFLDMPSRTHGRTDKRESIGLSAEAERPKTLKTVNFGKMAVNGANFAISQFSQHLEYDFLKEDHKNNFHTKN